MKQSKSTYQEIFDQFKNKKVLVIGDLILDVYLKGSSTRLSPEAPVPVVDIEERVAFPGGAANTACNLARLGADVTFCTVVGNDAHGDEAIRLLRSINVSPGSVIRHTSRSTIAKTRIVSGGHVITRYDQGCTDNIDKQTVHMLGRFIEAKYHEYDAVMLSDYAKGIITPALLDMITRLQQRHGKFIAVDSKRLPFFASLRPSLVKPNYDEAIAILGLPYLAQNRVQQVKTAAAALYDKVNAGIIAMSLDAEGSVIAEDGKVVHRCFAATVEHPHVSGAGDTYLSAFTLSQVVSGNAKVSGEIATAAAAIAVKKESTSHCSIRELAGYFNLGSKYIESYDLLKDLCKQAHESGKRIIFTNGCFDILHSGHVTYLHCVKRLGDILIVGVNTDDSIRRLKGETRPINTLTDRVQVLAGLGSVDYVVPFGDQGDDTPVSLLQVVRPHIFAKGGDYTKDRLPEAAIVEKLGGEIVFMPYLADHSTTDIVRKIGLTTLSRSGS